jgi:hypothetical protein
MNNHLQVVLIVLGFLAFSSCRDANKAKTFDQMAERIRTHYIEDSRVDRLELRHVSTLSGLLVEGYTTIPEAFDSINTVLSDGGFVVKKSNFRLLPDAELLNGKTVGIINVSVANLRSKPGHSQELATQALLGTPIQVLDFQGGWYLVRTPDRYIAWLEPGAFVGMKPREASDWLNSELKIFTDRPLEASKTPASKEYITDLVSGNIVAYGTMEEGDKSRIILPNGEDAWTGSTSIEDAPDWFRPETLNVAELLSTARLLKGRPYMWGGTSTKAMDCSGFTKMAYYLNGYVIPRDASQQVHAGEEVELTNDFRNLVPGDLLFFGRYRKDGSEKITHVAFYLGEGRFLHSGADNGRIKEESFLPEDEGYAEHRLKSLLRARRLSPDTKGVLAIGEAFHGLIK